MSEKQDDGNNKEKITKILIKEDNDKKSTINNPTINPLTIENPILNSRSLHKMNTTQRSRALSTNTKNIAQKIVDNLSFRKHVRFRGSIILFMILIISATHFTIFFLYANTGNSSRFYRISRPFVWVFLSFSIVYVLRFIHILVMWKNNATTFVKTKYEIEANSGFPSPKFIKHKFGTM